MAALEDVLESFDVAKDREHWPERDSQTRRQSNSRGRNSSRRHRNRINVHNEGVDNDTWRQYLHTCDGDMTYDRSEMCVYRKGVP